MIEPTIEDIAAMRRDGSFRDFIRHATGRPPVPAVRPEDPAGPAQAETGRRPGAWPAGTRPSPPARQVPAALWEQAVQEYRAWMAAGCPPGDATCQCGCTPEGLYRGDGEGR